MNTSTEKTLDAMRKLGAESLANTLWHTFSQIEWGEDEIRLAQERHPKSKDEVWGAFPLLRATVPLMREEKVYRAHCREILDRVVAGEDTREATHAEVAAGLSEYSLQRPLNLAAVTVYMRAFAEAFPTEAVEIIGDSLEANEKVAGDEADVLERDLRKAAFCDWRDPKEVTS